jgi:hypothetical protein
MNVIPSYQSGLLGIRRGMDGLDRNAAAVAQAAGSEGQAPVLKPLVAAMADRWQVQASAQVVRTTDSALGSLLDVKA